MSSFVDANLESYNEKRTQNNWAGDYAKNLVDTHRDAGVIDHPDKSVSFEKLSGEVQSRITNLEESAEKARTDLAKASNDINDTHSVAIQAMSASEAATETADDAKQKAENSATIAKATQSLATAAHTLANISNKNAIAAQEIADVADVKAEAAQSTADTAVGKADVAQSTADTAVGKANAAQSTADTAVGKANAAQNTADTAVGKANAAQNTADIAVGKADAAQNTADDNTTEITHKANKKEFEYIGTYTVTRDSDGTLPNEIIISADDNGEPFEITDFSIECKIATNSTTTFTIRCNDVIYWGGSSPGRITGSLKAWGIVFLRYGCDGTGLLGTSSITYDLSQYERYEISGGCMMSIVTGSDTIKKISIASTSTFVSGTQLVVKGVRKR